MLHNVVRISNNNNTESGKTSNIPGRSHNVVDPTSALNMGTNKNTHANVKCGWVLSILYHYIINYHVGIYQQHKVEELPTYPTHVIGRSIREIQFLPAEERAIDATTLGVTHLGSSRRVGCISVSVF